MNLYQLSNEFVKAMNDLAQQVEDGESREEVFFDTMEMLQGEWSDTALNVAKYIKSLEAESAAIKEAKDRMAEREKAINSRIESMKSYLLEGIKRTGITPKDAEIALGTRKSERLIVDDESLIGDAYRKVIPEQKVIDKNIIKAAIKSGAEISGARIESCLNLSIK